MEEELKFDLLPGGGHTPENVSTLQSFARSLAETILNASMGPSERTKYGEDHPASTSPPDRELPAEELATAAIDAALKEAHRSRTEENTENSVECQELESPLCPHRMEAGMKGVNASDKNPSFHSGVKGERQGASPYDVPMETECSGVAFLSELAATNTSSGPFNLHMTEGCPSISHLLSQSGLPAFGSLDYPDTPPTTPLFPDVIKRGDSFGRKLKGGLAKEFMPSPPPPTPKDKLNETDGEVGEWQVATVATRVDFMRRLMHCLSPEEEEHQWKDNLLSGTVEGSHGTADRDTEPQGGAKMAAYADVLSGNIVGWVVDHYPALRVTRKRDDNDDVVDNDGICLLAKQLAETIISSTINEAKAVVCTDN